MTGLEAALLKDFPAFTPRFTYRGTTAIYLALRAIAARIGEGEVIMPSTVCQDVPLAALFAGFTPRFCDVDSSTFCMSPKTIAAVLRHDTRAVIVVHLFGKAVDVTAIRKIAPKAFIIEDVAQAAGGELRGERLGGLGDFAIFSFDDKKILPGRGGVLLCKSANDAAVADSVSRGLDEPMPILDSARGSADFNAFARNIFDRLRAVDLLESDPSGIWERARGLRPLFIARFRPEDAVDPNRLSAYLGLSRQRQERFRRYREYASKLDPGVQFVRFEPTETCWRLPLLAPDRSTRDAVLAEIRSLGALASDHYFPMSLAFPADSKCPAALEIGLRALNLWVDDKTDGRLIPSVCAAINRCFEEFADLASRR